MKTISQTHATSSLQGRLRGGFALLLLLLFNISSSVSAQQTTRVLSPDGLTYLDVKFEDGKLSYSAGYRTIAKAKKKGAKADTLDVPMVLDSPLGVYTNVADFSKDLTLKETIRPEGTIKHNYHLRQGKQSEINNEENGLGLVLTTPQRRNGGVITKINGSCQGLVDLCILHPLRVPDRWRYGCDTIK